MTRISINSMLLGEFDSPLSPGNRLEDVGKFLGVPDRWDFGIEDEFICQLGYGDFELNLRTRANRVEIERLWIELWDTASGEPTPKAVPIRLTQGMKVDLGKFEPGLPLSLAKAALGSLDMSYEELNSKDASEIVIRLLLPMNAELLFFRGEDEPILMEIHFYSQTYG